MEFTMEEIIHEQFVSWIGGVNDIYGSQSYIFYPTLN